MDSARDVLYVVVDVMSGVAAGAACFHSEAAAQAHATELRKERDPNDDDVQVFVCTLDADTVST